MPLMMCIWIGCRARVSRALWGRDDETMWEVCSMYKASPRLCVTGNATRRHVVAVGGMTPPL